MVCSFEECKKKNAFIVGHCSYCSSDYCLAHRLPEQHKCNKIDLVRNIAISNLKEKLAKDALNNRNIFT